LTGALAGATNRPPRRTEWSGRRGRGGRQRLRGGVGDESFRGLEKRGWRRGGAEV